MQFNCTQLVSMKRDVISDSQLLVDLSFVTTYFYFFPMPNTGHRGIVQCTYMYGNRQTSTSTSRNTNLFLWHSKRSTRGTVSFPKKRLKAGRVPENLFRTSTSNMSSAPPRNTNSYRGTHIKHIRRLHGQI